MPMVTRTANGAVRSACTVTIDGVAIKSCSRLALACAGANVVTNEGLAIDGIHVDSERPNSDIRASAEYRAHAVIIMAKPVVEVAVSR